MTDVKIDSWPVTGIQGRYFIAPSWPEVFSEIAKFLDENERAEPQAVKFDTQNPSYIGAFLAFEVEDTGAGVKELPESSANGTSSRPCPSCQKPVRKDARSCIFCGAFW